jgi:hypothetical protein
LRLAINRLRRDQRHRLLRRKDARDLPGTNARPSHTLSNDIVADDQQSRRCLHIGAWMVQISMGAVCRIRLKKRRCHGWTIVHLIGWFVKGAYSFT